jgi:hypothetical protein
VLILEEFAERAGLDWTDAEVRRTTQRAAVAVHSREVAEPA